MSHELFFPGYIYPTEFEIALQDSIGAFQPQFGYGVTQRLDYGASRWQVRMVFEKLRDDERHEMLAFLTRAGRKRAFYLPIYANPSRGDGGFAELLTNPYFDGTTGWTAGTNYGITSSGRLLRAARSGVGAAATAFRNSSTVTVVNTANYAFRAHILKGNVDFDNLELRMGSTNGGEEHGDLTIAANDYGLFTQIGTMIATSLSVSIRDDDTAGQAVADYFDVAWMSAVRCGLVNGASQVGSGLITDGWPASTNDLLVAGDFVNIQLPTQLWLVRLTAAVNTTSGGAAYMQFEPALPESPANNAGIIPHSPVLKCFLSQPPTVRTAPPGYLSDVEIICEGVFG
jgi:hypothetical protein